MFRTEHHRMTLVDAGERVRRLTSVSSWRLSVSCFGRLPCPNPIHS
jgi:hypothetical protein